MFFKFIQTWVLYLYHYWPLKNWPSTKPSRKTERMERYFYSPISFWGLVYLNLLFMIQLYFLSQGWSGSSGVFLLFCWSLVVVDLVSLFFRTRGHLTPKGLKVETGIQGEIGVVHIHLRNDSHKPIHHIQMGLWTYQEGILSPLKNLVAIEAQEKVSIKLNFKGRWPGDYAFLGVKVHYLGFWGFFRKSQWLEMPFVLQVQPKSDSSSVHLDFISTLVQQREELDWTLKSIQAGDSVKGVDPWILAKKGQLVSRVWQDHLEKPKIKLGVDLSPLPFWRRPLREKQIQLLQGLLDAYGSHIECVWNVEPRPHHIRQVGIGFGQKKTRVQQITADYWLQIQDSKALGDTNKILWVTWRG